MIEPDMSPLFSFFGFLGIKYIGGIIAFAVVFSIIAELFGAEGSISPLAIMLNALAIAALSLSVAFIGFVIYNLRAGQDFRFLPLMISAATIFFLASLMVTVRTAVSDGHAIHVALPVLAFVTSIVAGAVLSMMVKIAQRFL